MSIAPMKYLRGFLAMLQVDPRQLWRRYLVGMSLILMLIGGSHYIALSSIEMGSKDAQLINDSGRQRMLSQRILHFANSLYRERTSGNYAGLAAATQIFEDSHMLLVNQTVDLPHFRALFEERTTLPPLNDMVRDYIAGARVLLHDSGPQSVSAINTINDLGPGKLPIKLNQLVDLFEAEANQHQRRLKAIQQWMLGIAIGLILLEALFIFWPAHNTTKRAISRLERQRECLRQARQNAEDRLEALESAKERMKHDALHDPLTGLANRHFVETELVNHFKVEQQLAGLTMMHIDLDRFKQINDTLGHAAGDHILCHVADVLCNHACENDVIARVGGDEFAIISETVRTRADAANLAERVIEDLRQPVQFKGNTCFFGASIGIGLGIGISRNATSGQSLERLLVNADIALNLAKQKGRGRFEFFTPALQRDFDHSKQISDELTVGLARQEIVPHYQLQVDARTRKVVGAEALARWMHPTRGLMTPDKFLPIAETLNVAADIDHMILRTALEDFKAWTSGRSSLERISVNVSAQRLANRNLPDIVADLNIPKGRLCFELTETIFFDRDIGQIGDTVERLRDLGIEIELDDFGTGYSSILSLQKLRPTRLKIDRELITPITHSKGQLTLVKAIIEMAGSMDIEVVAEGVETHEQADMLTELGCTTLQGYLFARPKPASEITADLATAQLKHVRTSVPAKRKRAG